MVSMKPRHELQPERVVRALDGNDVCVCIHTALRKYCDSFATVVMYNLIHLLVGHRSPPREHNPWNLFGAEVAKRLAAGMPPIEAAKDAVVCFDTWWFLEDDDDMSDRRRHQTWAHCMFPLFLCFTAEDWEGTCFLLKA